ncbi:MAG: aldo/keto reductase [Acidobacteria bacterium]|nr:aldo/keto reductase [Acidobacteriota bacterium]
MSGQTRRDFLLKSVSGAAAVGAGLGVFDSSSLATKAEIPRRTLGRTGEKVSAICLGGYHIGIPKNPDDGIRIIEAAIDRGINFLDNSDDYHAGESEIRMGKAIKGKRDKVFLMTKPHPRDKKGAMASLDESLRRLQTDHLDLWQFHEIVYETDPDWIFSPNGAVEAAYIAKKQGKVRYIGFTGHHRPEYHLKMLSKPYDWDTVQMPLNAFDNFYRSFQKQVLPVLVQRNIGVIGMKPLASGTVVKSKVVTPIEALHYALNLPTSTVVTGCDSMEILEQAIQAVTTFKPLTESQIASIHERVKPLALTGEYEPFKSTTAFNGPRVAPPPFAA